MKTRYSMILTACALGATSILAVAQDAPGGRPGGARPPSPIMAALDANKDGEIDATELANATVALKALDKNGDGKLSGEEIRPARGQRGGGAGGPGGPGGGGRGPGGAGGPGGENKAK